MEFLVLALIGGAVMGAGGTAAFLWPKLVRAQSTLAVAIAERDAARKGAAAMTDQFELLATRAMRSAQDQFLTLATEKLSGTQKDAGHDLDKRHKAIADLVDPVAKTLKEMEGRLAALGQSDAVLQSQLKNFADDQRALRDQTAALAGALKNTATRGNWGELQLERTLEMAGLVENIHFKQQVTVTNDGAAQRPDFVVHLPGNLSIVIDVKAPIEPYWAMQDDSGNVTIAADAVQNFKAKLRDHLKRLSAKVYWQQFDSPQFVVMFLPTEGLFSSAVATDKTLIEDAAAANVILASPTTILGLLRVIAFAWQQQALADNARKIGVLATNLNGRMGTFLDHMQKLGRNLGSTINAFNSAIGTVEAGLLPNLRKMDELQGSAGTDFADVPQLDHTPRLITAPTDMTEKDDKAA